MALPQRKPLRLPDYDYSTDGAYFVTICTHNRETLFGDVLKNSASKQMLSRCLADTLSNFPNASCPKSVIMPNHFHAIIIIDNFGQSAQPSLEQIIQDFKSRSTVAYIKLVKEGILPTFNKKIWQRSFYEHVIRNEQDYLEIWKYIDDNPRKWLLDDLFVP